MKYVSDSTIQNDIANQLKGERGGGRERGPKGCPPNFVTSIVARERRN